MKRRRGGAEGGRLKIQINKAFLYFRRRCIQQLPPQPLPLPTPLAVSGLNNDDVVPGAAHDDDDDDYFGSGVLLCLCLLHLQWKCRSSASTLHAKCILNASLPNAGAATPPPPPSKSR